MIEPMPWSRFPDKARAMPACRGILAPEIRRGMWIYRATGFVGKCMRGAMGYLIHLESELARREAMDALRREAAESFG